MKEELKQLLRDNPNMTFETWEKETNGKSKRSYYNYLAAVKAEQGNTPEVHRNNVQQSTYKEVVTELKAVRETLEELETEREEWEKERKDLLRAVEELPYEKQELEKENKELCEQVATLQVSANLLDAVQKENAKIRESAEGKFAQVQNECKSKLHDASNKLHNADLQFKRVQKERDECNEKLHNVIKELAQVQENCTNAETKLAQVQNYNDFLQSESEIAAAQKQDFGRKSVWFLVVLILVTSFKNVWNGFSGVETDNISSFMFSLIFAIAGFCIMQIAQASRRLQLFIGAVCISWECAFSASTLFSNMYKVAQVQENFAQVQKVQVAPIVQQISGFFETDAQNTAFVISWLLSISVATILYSSIYLLTSKIKSNDKGI